MTDKVISFENEKEKRVKSQSNRFILQEALGLTELRLAKTFMQSEKHVGKWIYNKTRKNWMSWDDKQNVWSEDTDNRMYKAIAEYVEDISMEYTNYTFDDKDWNKIERFIVKMQSHQGIMSLIQCCKAEALVISETELDSELHLINLTNGIYDLLKNDFYPSEWGKNKNFLLTKRCNASYTEGQSCELWKKTLLDIFLNDVEYIDYVQRIFAYIMCGGNPQHAVFIFHGENGRNGKTTILNVLAEIMGDYFKAVPARAFTRAGKDQELTLAELYGKRFALISETERGAELAQSLLKSISGGNTVSGRRLYQSTIEYKPEYKIVVETNHLPAIYNDNATWERMHTVKFERYFQPHERDMNLEMKLMTELDGIFLWLLEGWDKYREKGLTKPEKAVKHTQAHRDEFDTMKHFIDECFVFTDSEDDFILPNRLYDIYCEWIDRNRLKGMNGRQFGIEFKKRKETTFKDSKRMMLNGKAVIRSCYIKMREA